MRARLLSLFVLSTSVVLAQTPEDPANLSFAEQARVGNIRYLRGTIDPHLNALDAVNDTIGNEADSPLSHRLDEGERLEPTIVSAVEEVIAFQKRHNGRIDGWSSKSEASESQRLYGVLRMSPQNVKRAREEAFEEPWPYVAVHWSSHAIDRGLEDHPIPSQGLELAEELFLSDEADVTRYAFFHFLRKASATVASPALQAFLDRHLATCWSGPLKTVQFRRWKRADYYEYQYVAEPPSLPAGTLAFRILSQCCPAPKTSLSDLSTFYDNKVLLFRDTASEATLCMKQKRSPGRYWELYAFVARTHPHVSPFKPRMADDGTWLFVDGYPKDRPAGLTFGPASVAGHGYQLYLAAGGTPEAARKVFRPLLLLPMRFTPKAPRSLIDSDIRVGYRGFLDLFHALSRRTAGD